MNTQQLIKRLVTVLISATLLASPVSAQASTPDPTTQGGADGVLFMTESSDNAIYVGDFKATPTAKSIFWQSAGSVPNEVAVTKTRIAWASNLEANPSATPPRAASTILSKVLITNVGKKAGKVKEVTVPGNAVITGLAADYFNEKFYLTTKTGDVYSVNSDGTALTKLISADATVAKVTWGFWVDPYNAKAYWCDGDAQASTGRLTSSNITASGLSTPTDLSTSFLKSCDGLGVDPATQTVFAAAFQATTTNGDDFWAKYETSTSAYTSLTITGTTKRAPSSMFVSHSTSKIYFTTEQEVYEVNYDGTGLRVLYTGSHDSLGFENLAVYYGATLDTINAAGGGSSSDSAVSKTIYFASNSATLSKAAKKTLNALVKKYPNPTSVTINGYVQSSDTTANNKSLSKKRAAAVSKYLKSKGWTGTITTVAKGLPKSKASAAKARRVVISVTP